MDRACAQLVVGRAPNPLKTPFVDLPKEVMDVAIRAAFQLGPEIEWRWPESNEHIYDRGDDGYIGVWLEHLRSGWNPQCHNFVKYLFKYEYEISIMQVTPNGIKWVIWFLACCEKSEYIPTFRLFHQLFQLVRSNKKPLYELRFRAKECGFPSGSAQPVIQQSTLKGWSGEVLMLRGWDLGGMPHIVLDKEAKIFETVKLTGSALRRIRKFCGILGFQCTRDTFMDHKKLFELGCFPHYNQGLEDIMSYNTYSLALRKISGVHNDKVKKAGEGSGSTVLKEGGAESAAPVLNHPAPDVESIDVENIGTPDDWTTKKRRISIGRKPPSRPRVVVEKITVDDKGKGADGQPVMVGSCDLKKLASLAYEIPTDEDVDEMKRSGVIAVLKRAIGHWGHSEALISGAATVFVHELESLNQKLKEKEDRNQILENELSSLKTTYDSKVSDLSSEVSKLKAQVTSATEESGAMKDKYDDLQAELSKSKEEIIAEFQKSAAYDQAIADAGAPEIYRTFVVAEKHLKTDPNACWESFIDHFVAAKKDIEDGLGEPMPYDGPNPFIIPAGPDSPQPSK
ncbi:hypothetical protein POM88_021693 [Heracleum sosnowskyi]|uniref:Transposase (putative) gypsy type domain-containing protein n=1 Tax=Heracleum sosnowskyi TaxID=360622 RepID=A0AAD8MU21_9APIA|nr:hypothetical protein POM88_021693 [Heracleum sosnowskyi]